jgi:transposase-like protein
MSDIHCKSCGSVGFVKSGFVRGLQRYKCKDCDCNFTATARKGKPASMKALAVFLYGMCNASQGMIARLLGISHVSVYRWMRKEAQAMRDPEVPADIEIVQIDEMWYFVNGKKTKFGSGKPMIHLRGEISPGKSAHVLIER